VKHVQFKKWQKYAGKFCDIECIDGTGGAGKVIKIEQDYDGKIWLVLDYGYAFRADSIKRIEIMEDVEEIEVADIK